MVGCRKEGEDTVRDICHILTSLGYIWGNVMPQVEAVTSSSPNEAAGRTDHEKNQRQKDRKEEERAHSLRHL